MKNDQHFVVLSCKENIQAVFQHMHHSCDVVIMMHHKHGNGDTMTFYGTEGAGISFIGNKADIKASEGAKMA